MRKGSQGACNQPRGIKHFPATHEEQGLSPTARMEVLGHNSSICSGRSVLDLRAGLYNPKLQGLLVWAFSLCWKYSARLRFYNLPFLSARQPQTPPLREPSCTSNPTVPKLSKLLTHKAYLTSPWNLILTAPSFPLLLSRSAHSPQQGAQGSCMYLEAESKAGNNTLMGRTNKELQSLSSNSTLVVP